MGEKSFTLEDIKRAFWKTFHQSGEQWFPYPWPLGSDDAVGAEDTEYRWGEFLEALGVSGEGDAEDAER